MMTIEDVASLALMISEDLVEMGEEVNRKIVDWKRVDRLHETIMSNFARYYEAQKEVREREIAKIRNSVLQVSSEIPTGAGLSDSAGSRAGADLPGGNAPVGVAVL